MDYKKVDQEIKNMQDKRLGKSVGPKVDTF